MTRRSLIKKGDIRNSKVLQNTEKSPITLEQIGLSMDEIRGNDLFLIQMPKDVSSAAFILGCFLFVSYGRECCHGILLYLLFFEASV